MAMADAPYSPPPTPSVQTASVACSAMRNGGSARARARIFRREAALYPLYRRFTALFVCFRRCARRPRRPAAAATAFREHVRARPHPRDFADNQTPIDTRRIAR